MKTSLLFLFFLWTVTSAAQNVGVPTDDDGTYYFDVGATELTKAQKKILKKHFGKRNPQNFQGVLGYSDTIGTPQERDSVSLRRARAVADYIKEIAPKIKTRAFIGLRGYTHLSLPQEKQRSAVLVKMILCGTDMEGYKTEGDQGIYAEGYLVSYYKSTDTTSNDDRDYIKVTAYRNARQMIAGQKNAVDAKGNVLKVLAIVNLCVNNGWMAPNGYKVHISSWNKNPEKDYKVYLNTGAAGMPEQWVETDVKVTISNGWYLFNLPNSTGCSTICFGKPTVSVKRGKPIKPETHKAVYISTYKPYDFVDVNAGSRAGSLSYSAKINDTLIAFTLPAMRSAKGMLFEGVYKESGKETTLSIPLKDCIVSKDADGNEYYYICEACAAEKPAQRKKGFWAWVKRTLGVR